eukprot:8950-Heterococcus_DN1.PRE.2
MAAATEDDLRYSKQLHDLLLLAASCHRGGTRANTTNTICSCTTDAQKATVGAESTSSVCHSL